jgi:SAM-dependent methyltransferase
VKEILDVACGGGRHVVGLAKRGYGCTGYDFTAERIQTAKARAKRSGVSVTLRRGDATQLRFNKEFDAVLALYILFLLPDDEDIQRCLRGIHRALKPGGIMVSNVFNPFTTGKTWVAELLRKGEVVKTVRARGIRITEIMKVRSLDPVRGVMWVDEASFVEAPDGKHVFRDRERARLLTYWEMLHHLQEAGFSNVECYPDWNRKRAEKKKAEQLVFIGQK